MRFMKTIFCLELRGKCRLRHSYEYNIIVGIKPQIVSYRSLGIMIENIIFPSNDIEKFHEKNRNLLEYNRFLF